MMRHRSRTHAAAPGRSFVGSSFGAVSSTLLLVALLAFGATPARADFWNHKVPVPDWAVDAAKTPTPDSVKDAEVVYLLKDLLVTVDAQGRATERDRVVLRILKPQGREKAYCAAGFDIDEKLNFVRAWSIASDGKQFSAADTDFFEVGDTENPILMRTYHHKVARPPAADPGSVIVCESEVVTASYMTEENWQFQETNPVVKAVLELDLPPGRAYTASWHRYEAVKPVEVQPNHWRWEIDDLRPLKLRDVPSHPEVDALLGRMSVQWGDAAIAGVDNQWRAIGQWMDQIEAHRPDPTPEITAKTQELIAGAPDFYSKLNRIADYVQKNIRYFIIERGIGGLQAHPASDIFHNRYGDCKDKATITISMLQVAGISAHYLAVDDRRDVVDPQSPSLMGDHMITAIEVPDSVHDPRLVALTQGKSGKTYLIFDPTNETTPIGTLPYYEEGSFGILAAGPDSQLLPIPVVDPAANGLERVARFTLSGDGTLSGSVTTKYIGSDAGDMRRALKHWDDKEQREWVEGSVGQQVAGAVVDDYKFVGAASLDQPLEFDYKLTAHQYAHPAGPLLLVRPHVVGTNVLAFDGKPRTVPIDLNSSGHWHSSFDITLPDGYVVDETPDPVEMDTDFATYRSKFEVKGNVLHYESDFVRRKVELPAAKFAEFQHFQGVMMADEKSTAVLKKQ